ncbi:MAG TPA: hypothetical protein VGP93_03070, partial [Polyangiaceae bacterium]|nr:hypothetical protein [Polyangiaceae bacterium]
MADRSLDKRSSTLHLVPHDRQAELAALRGQSAVTLRRLVTALAGSESTRRATTPEMTRLACANALGRSGRYAAAFDNAIGALRRAGVSVAHLARLSLARATRFAEVMAQIDGALESKNLRDERADAWLAAHAVTSVGPGVLAEHDTLLVRGLCRFDAGELGLFEALHSRSLSAGGRGLVLELPLLELAPATAALHRVAQTLEARWASQGHPPSLEHREPDVAAKLELVAAHDDASEARAAAHVLLDALGRGVSIDRMAVAVPELSEAFLEPLRQELEAAKIPYFEPRGRPLLAAPHAHAALELMKLARGPLDRDALVDVLRTPGLDARRWSGELACEEWAAELASLPLRIDRSGQELLLELGARAQESTGSEEVAQRIRKALAASKRCLSELEAERGPKPRREFRAGLLSLLGELGLTAPSPALLALALERRAGGRGELLRALGDNGAGMRALATALERTSDAAAALGAGDEAITLEQYLGEIELAAEGVGPTRGARRGAALWVARPEELAGLELDLVVLCRATSAGLEGAGAENADLLGDDLGEALPADRRPTSRALAASFPTLAIAWLLWGAQRAVVTYAERDARGPTTPSQLVVALKRQLRETREPGSPLHPSARRVTPLSPLGTEAERRVRVETERQLYFLDPELPAGPFTGAAGELGSLIGGDQARPL